MGQHKYYKFMVDNDGDRHKIARSMKILDENMVTDKGVCSIFYGLRIHCTGRAIIEGYIHFYDKTDGRMVVADMREFDLWACSYHDMMVLSQHLQQGQCIFTKHGARYWNAGQYDDGIKMDTTTYYNFEI